MCIYTYLDIKVVLLSLCCPKHLIQWFSCRWLLNLYFVICLWDKVSLWKPGWLQTPAVLCQPAKCWRYRWAPSCLDNFLSKTNPQPPNFCFLKLPNLGSPSSIVNLLSVHPQCSVSCSNLSSWSPLLHQSYLPRKLFKLTQPRSPHLVEGPAPTEGGNSSSTRQAAL